MSNQAMNGVPDSEENAGFFAGNRKIYKCSYSITNSSGLRLNLGSLVVASDEYEARELIKLVHRVCELSECRIENIGGCVTRVDPPANTDRQTLSVFNLIEALRETHRHIEDLYRLAGDGITVTSGLNHAVAQASAFQEQIQEIVGQTQPPKGDLT